MLRRTQFMSVMAGVFLAAVTLLPTAARAAADCRGNPAGVAPNGKHWYYHLNRVTQQKCWYLGMKRSTVRVAARKPVRAPSSAFAKPMHSPVPLPPSIANAQASIQDTVNQATARNEVALSKAGVAREVTYEELLKSTFGSRWADPIDMARPASSRSVSNAAGIRQPSPALASLHTRFSEAADYLVTEGRSSADVLAVLLASAGGLLVLVGMLGRLQVARSSAPEYPDPLYYPQFDDAVAERPLLTFAPRDLDEADEPDRYGIPAAPLQAREVDAAAEEAARPLFAPPMPGRFNAARKSQLLARTAAE